MIELGERRTYLDERLKLSKDVSSHPRIGATRWRDSTICRREIGVSAVPAVAIHADLAPMNIIVDQTGRVAVLDFTMAKKGTAHHDLSHVASTWSSSPRRIPRRRGSIEALQRAMLAGYRPI